MPNNNTILQKASLAFDFRLGAWKIGSVFPLIPIVKDIDGDLAEFSSQTNSSTYIDKNGIEQTAQQNQPRFSYDIDGNFLGVVFDNTNKDAISIYNITDYIGQGTGSIIFETTIAQPVTFLVEGEELILSGNNKCGIVYTPTKLSVFVDGQLIIEKTDTFDFSGMDFIDIGHMGKINQLGGFFKYIYFFKENYESSMIEITN